MNPVAYDYIYSHQDIQWWVYYRSKYDATLQPHLLLYYQKTTRAHKNHDTDRHR